MFHGLWDGCQINVHFDNTIEDVIIYERNNKSYVSMKENFNNLLRNEIYVKDRNVCAKKNNGTVIVAQCDCENCVEIFDFQHKFAYAKRELCPSIQNQGPSCKCFEISKVTLASENHISYQDHKVCTECKYDSQCRLFNPLSYCHDDTNRMVDGSLYKIGNPLKPNVSHHTHTDWIRDKGRVTNGEIRGDTCECDT